MEDLRRGRIKMVFANDVVVIAFVTGFQSLVAT